MASRFLVVTIPESGVVGRAAYPDKGSVGLATHTPGGHVRFGVTATAASAVLYGAVVLLGVKAASPSALGRGGDRDSSVVLIRPHDSPASGPRQRLPQASPGPERQRTEKKARRPSPPVGLGTRPSVPRPASTPAQPAVPARPRATESKPSSPAPTQTSTATTPLLELTPPSPEPLPAVPQITLPEVPAGIPALPVPLVAAPALPQLPAVSELPG